MALWKDKTRGDWRYEFQRNGERYTGTGFRTKTEAREAQESRRRELKSRKIPIATAFSVVANEYLDYAQRRFAKKTYDYKALVYRRFLEHIKEDLPVEDITPRMLHVFLNTRPTNYNYNAHRKDMCALFSFARRQLKVNFANPCWDLEKMPYTPPKKDLIPQQDLLRLLMAADPETERPLLLVLLHTLARVDEALRLNWDDVNFQNQTIVLWTRKRKGGGYECDTLPMNNDLYDVLWGLWQKRKQDIWVFYNEKTDNRFNRRPKLMPGLCKRAGLKQYGFHHLRHFMATHLADSQKVSKKAISGLLRHKALGTTELYLGSTDESQRAAMQSVEGMFGDLFGDTAQNPQKRHKQAD